ncbi:alpha/beta hydrolase [Pseudovibrio sp. Tun.PSC04-5.I4]|uniref:alpha/beta fold hydrolase n=1 Tax=Pseudovibrio sp. Tun.PSC04-5.I4 TaxID=1798213 RepID=UPI00088E1995|nr:alpha/beta hydrolase [Pseudovibrio sp. Tun.PSC04-5.I4]SDQ21228.1 Pimeloyl-ACP methyl ester carboxylesterase [Pseudovibrio sp. Tun.PSC04-5.I4]
MKFIEAGMLNVAYKDVGPKAGVPVFLLHGFPYDVHCYDEVCVILANRGFRCIIPYLRGFGPTQYLSSQMPRSGQQAALAFDLRSLMIALEIPEAIMAGYDWGGRAACIAAALWPEKVRGLVSGGVAYNIQNIPAAYRPADPRDEHLLWYQYYFHNERGKNGLEENREDLTKLLWQQWSPNWDFSRRTFRETAESFDNPDFVETVIHSYRHRFGLVAGDPAVEKLEVLLTAQPKINVPTIALLGAGDGVSPPRQSKEHHHNFTSFYEVRVVDGVGHNLPQENPDAFANAVIEIADRTDT